MRLCADEALSLSESAVPALWRASMHAFGRPIAASCSNPLALRATSPLTGRRLNLRRSFAPDSTKASSLSVNPLWHLRCHLPPWGRHLGSMDALQERVQDFPGAPGLSVSPLWHLRCHLPPWGRHPSRPREGLLSPAARCSTLSAQRAHDALIQSRQ